MLQVNKLLILGSDLGTIDLVREFHNMGGYCITSDTMNSSPTRELSDETWSISTLDIDALEDACRNAEINCILSGASEINTDSIRELSKRMNLPTYCVDDEAYAIARDKGKFKMICKEIGAPIATDYTLCSLSKEELGRIIYPVVIKPVDQSGNRGVSFCNTEEELVEAYKNAMEISDSGKVVCERQLHGPEWCVEYVLAEGEAKILLFSKEHHQPGEEPCLYSIINTSSHYLKKYIDECDEKVRQVFKKAGFREGIAWVEIMLDEDGCFYLLECGHRLTSEALYAFYEKITGFNSIRWLIEASLGVRHSVEQLPDICSLKNTKSSVAYSLFSKHDGILKVGGLEEIEKLPNVTLDIPRRGGNQINKRGMMGAIKLYGTCDEIIETLKFINKTLIMENEYGEDILIRFTDYDAFRTDFNLGLKEMGSIE